VYVLLYEYIIMCVLKYLPKTFIDLSRCMNRKSVRTYASERMTESNTTGTNANIGSGTDGITIHTDIRNEDYHSLKIGNSRISSYAIFILGLLGLYSFSASKYLFAQQELSLIYYGENDATLRRCVDSADGLWTPQENYLTHRSNMHKKNESVDFRIMCTSINKRIAWGSYKLRCNDLKRWVDVCVPNVDITVGVSIEQLHERWSNKNNSTSQVGSILSPNRTSDNDIFYNATIFVKSMSRKDFPQFGSKFIDIVDEYNWKEEKIPPEMHLILQTRWQGQSMYPNHTSSVVEHWYNSYPSDMVNGGYLEYIPSTEQKSSRRLHIATIWNTRRSHDPTEGGCPTLNIPGAKYDCIDKVSLWLGISYASRIRIDKIVVNRTISTYLFPYFYHSCNPERNDPKNQIHLVTILHTFMRKYRTLTLLRGISIC
jgi:hypothetical protein